MLILGQNILSILALSAVLALIVYAFGLIVPALFGRPSASMSVVDLVALTLFIALVVFLLRASGLWLTLGL